jgi:hypothetical protein
MYIMNACMYIRTYVCMQARTNACMYYVFMSPRTIIRQNKPSVGNTEFCVLHNINSDVHFGTFAQYIIPEGPQGIMACF